MVVLDVLEILEIAFIFESKPLSMKTQTKDEESWSGERRAHTPLQYLPNQFKNDKILGTMVFAVIIARIAYKSISHYFSPMLTPTPTQVSAYDEFPNQDLLHYIFVPYQTKMIISILKPASTIFE